MISDLDDANYLNLATFRRNGNAVRTPVWFASANDHLYVFSAGDAGKVKRLRNSSRIEVARCNMRGAQLGDWHNGEAFLVADEAECRCAYEALRSKYGMQMAALDLVSCLAGKINKRQLIRIELGEAP